jgi:hypothetical protein
VVVTDFLGDAKLYCVFLNFFANELHKHQLLLSVDVARWSKLWDFPLLAKTQVDRIVTMQTYTTHLDRFESEVNYTVNTLGGKAVIGLDTDIKGMLALLNCFVLFLGYTPEILNKMLALLRKYRVNEVNLWTGNLILTHEWLSFLDSFLAS